MNLKLPNFLVVGFPKCGSTSIYYYLKEHPEIFLPSQKELHYFTYPIISKQNKGKGDKNIKQFHISSLEEYQKCFKSVKNEKAIGDVSPSYANYPEVYNSISERLGKNVKIIALLRDPIKRAYSNYLHLVREEREHLPFFEALQSEEDRKNKMYSDFWYYTFNSMYYDKIARLKDNFSDLLIVNFEDFVNNPAEGIKKIYNFLEVNPDFIPEKIDTHYNPGGVYKKNALTQFIFKPSPIKDMLKKLIPITSGMKQLKIKAIDKYRESTPPIDKNAENFLIEKFKEDVQKLDDNFNVKIHYWNRAFNKS